MGQQQLLLVILVTIIVGIATVVAINIFGTASDQANKDAIRQDLLTAASQVQAIYARPVLMGGAGRDIAENLSQAEVAQLTQIPGVINGAVIDNDNAEYEVTTLGAASVTMTATAKGSNAESDWTMTVNDTDADGIWNISITDADGNVSEVNPTEDATTD